MLQNQFDVDEKIIEPIYKDKLTITEYFDQNTIYDSKIVEIVGKINEINKSNNSVGFSLFSENYNKREYSLGAYLDSELWKEDESYVEIIKSIEVGDEISIKGIFETNIFRNPTISIIKLISINGVNISENKNENDNKVVFSKNEDKEETKTLEDYNVQYDNEMTKGHLNKNKTKRLPK